MNWSMHGNWCLAEPGRTYAVYLPKAGKVTVRLEPGRYHAEWFNPMTGESIPIGVGRGPVVDLARGAGKKRLGAADPEIGSRDGVPIGPADGPSWTSPAAPGRNDSGATDPEIASRDVVPIGPAEGPSWTSPAAPGRNDWALPIRK